MRQTISSGGPLEKQIGYSRVVRAGPNAYVAGTTALGPDGVAEKGDAGKQLCVSIERIQSALKECDMGLEHIVRTRVFMRHVEDWESIGAAHGRAFSKILPVTAFYAGVEFVHPDILVEIEADAYLSAD